MIVDKFSPSELPQNISFYFMAGIRAKNGINLQNSKLKHLDLKLISSPYCALSRVCLRLLLCFM